MKNNCKNCEFWEIHQTYSLVSKETLGRCKKAPQFWDATEWVEQEEDDYDFDQITRELKEEHKNIKFFVNDASNYHAELITKENFYCNEYKQK